MESMSETFETSGLSVFFLGGVGWHQLMVWLVGLGLG